MHTVSLARRRARTLGSAALLLAFGCWLGFGGTRPAQAQGAPPASDFTVYTLSGVTFNEDGAGTVTGYFDYDPATGAFGSYSLATSPGTYFDGTPAASFVYDNDDDGGPDGAPSTDASGDVFFSIGQYFLEDLSFSLATPLAPVGSDSVTASLEYSNVLNELRDGNSGAFVAAPIDPTYTLSSVSLVPELLAGGTERVTATVAISGAAPIGGVVVGLQPVDPSVARVPATILIPAGATTTSFNVLTKATAATTTLPIFAFANGATATATLTITPQPKRAALSFLELAPATVTGGISTITNRVYLNGNAAQNVPVYLTSSNPAVASVTRERHVTAGTSSRQFTINTVPVTSAQTVTITAEEADGTSESATLTVTP